MEKFRSRTVVVVDGSVVGTAEDFTDIEVILGEYAENHPDGKEGVGRVRLLNVMHELNNVTDDGDHFMVRFIPGKPEFSEPGDYGLDSEKFIDEDGREFDSIEDLQDRITDDLDAGYIDIEDVRRMQITRVTSEEIRFDDAQEGELVTEIIWNNPLAQAKSEYLNQQYVRFDEVQALIEEQVALYKKKQAEEQAQANVNRPHTPARDILEREPLQLSNEELKEYRYTLKSRLRDLETEIDKRDLY